MAEKPDKKKKCPTCKLWGMSEEDANFWGECKSCRNNLPIQTTQDGDKRGASTDRKYHGGTGWTGEW